MSPILTVASYVVPLICGYLAAQRLHRNTRLNPLTRLLTIFLIVFVIELLGTMRI